MSGLSESAGLDAQVLLAHALGKERSWLLAHPEATISAVQAAAWEEMLGRVEAGEALPYVLGEWEFFGLKLRVTPETLIPRPETELLVEAALEWLKAHPGRRRAADVGTGSGCIAVALAANMPDLQVTASDISAGAVQVAAENARRHKLGQRVRVVQADLLDGVEGPFDLISANLPYIPSERVKDLDVYAREPHIALDGGADGLVFIRGLMQQAQSKLAAGGLLLAEIDPELAHGMRALAQEYFAAGQLSIRADLAGGPRLVIIAK